MTETFNRNLILQDIPLFNNLKDKERKIIRDRSVVLEYKKGEIIYKEGSSPSAFYCVVTGRVMIYAQGQEGSELILEYLHRGKYFGIISLLTGEAHSVTAKAVNDCSLLVIKKEDFDFILHKIPRIAIDLSLTLSRRLKNKDAHPKSIFESTVISTFSSYSHAGKTLYALNLALSLKKEIHKSVLILDILPQDKDYSLPDKLEVAKGHPVLKLTGDLNILKALPEYLVRTKFGVDLICLDYQPQANSCVRRLVEVLSALVNDYNYIILDLPALSDECIYSMLNQSDAIHILSSPDPEDLKQTRSLILKLKTEFDFPEDKVKVIINEYKQAKVSFVEEVDLLGHSIFATLPKIEENVKGRLVLGAPDSEYAKAVRRISRSVGDAMVGLALGVGVGYGFCHIGVLKVIEEEDIPIDVISGASIGSIIASLWASGRSAREILEITKEFREPFPFWNLMDLTFPWRGFIKGNKLQRFLKKYLGNKTFYDVKLPLRIIASDIRRKEARVFDKGSLVDAIMASCSMPGVFNPFALKEGILFDGGIINPLPTEVLFKMGIKKIIAVNVTPSREDMLKRYEKIKVELATTYDKVKKRQWMGLKAYLNDKFKSNILDIVFSSIEVMQAELVQKEAQLADVVLHPDTGDLHWLELHRAAEFARLGEAETRKNLDKIWNLINE